MMLVSMGAPVTPDGGSFCNRRKSRSKRRRALVDMMIFCFDAAFDVYTSIKWWVVNAPKFEPQRSPMRDDFVRSGGLYFGGIS